MKWQIWLELRAYTPSSDAGTPPDLRVMCHLRRGDNWDISMSEGNWSLSIRKRGRKRPRPIGLCGMKDPYERAMWFGERMDKIRELLPPLARLICWDRYFL